MFFQILGAVDGGPSVPVAALFLLARGTQITHDGDVTAVRVTPLHGDSGQGVAVEWKSNLGSVHLTLPSPKEIARLPNGGYHRFLSPALVSSDYGGEKVSIQGHGIWETFVFA